MIVPLSSRTTWVMSTSLFAVMTIADSGPAASTDATMPVAASSPTFLRRTLDRDSMPTTEKSLLRNPTSHIRRFN